MFTAHLVDVEAIVDWTRPETWWSITSGRSSVLFAVLAGVSLALMSGGQRRAFGRALTVARRRIAVRGVFVFAVGVGLVVLEPPVFVILPTYGLLFLLVVPVLRLRRRTLLIMAGVAAVLAMPAFLVTVAALPNAGAFTTQLVIAYPLVTWIVYLLVGLALGRTLPSSSTRLGLIGGLGVAAAVVAYGVGELVTPGGALFTLETGTRLRDLVFASEPHSSTLVDIVGSLGVAVAVIAACSLVAPRGGLPARLLARMGAMPLTIYTVHVVVIAWLEHSGVLPSLAQTERVLVLAAFAVASLAFAWLWGGRRGPLEWVAARLALAVGGAPRT